MTSKLMIMSGLAVVFGSTSYYTGNQYLENRANARLQQIESRATTSQELLNVVVATKALSFGEKLNAQDLKIVPWPKSAFPKGSYTSIEQAIGDGTRKVVQPMEQNEPILSVKLTGVNGRGGLAGIISEGMRAVTIPVDMVDGVGGFVLPGDRVDIVFSQREETSGRQTARIIMENVLVLSIDQQVNSREDSHKIAKSVTLETDTAGAQKLALANTSGNLSLLLRGAGDNKPTPKDTIVLNDGETTRTAKNEEGTKVDGDANFLSFLSSEKKQTSIKVVQGKSSFVSEVPIDRKLRK